MSTDLLRKYAGWAAVTAGSLELLGLVSLILFFALELPQGSTSTLRFGYLSDVIPILTAPLNIIVMVMIFLLQRKHALSFSAISALLGISGSLLSAWTNIMFVSGNISLERQVQLFYISLAFLGTWHILVNSLARHHGLLPSRLTIFGILTGMGQVIMYISSLLITGYGDLLSSSPTAIMTNILLLISLVIAIPMALLGYLGAPIWLVWLGQTLLRSYNKIPSMDNLDAAD